MLILCCPRTGTSCQSNFSQLHRTLTLWGCIGGGLCSRDGSVSLTLDSQSYLHLVFPLSGSRSVPPSSHVSGAPLHYQGWRNTKLNVIPFMLIKKKSILLVKKTKKPSSKANYPKSARLRNIQWLFIPGHKSIPLLGLSYLH